MEKTHPSSGHEPRACKGRSPWLSPTKCSDSRLCKQSPTLLCRITFTHLRSPSHLKPDGSAKKTSPPRGRASQTVLIGPHPDVPRGAQPLRLHPSLAISAAVSPYQRHKGPCCPQRAGVKSPAPHQGPVDGLSSYQTLSHRIGMGSTNTHLITEPAGKLPSNWAIESSNYAVLADSLSYSFMNLSHPAESNTSCLLNAHRFHFGSLCILHATRLRQEGTVSQQQLQERQKLVYPLRANFLGHRVTPQLSTSQEGHLVRSEYLSFLSLLQWGHLRGSRNSQTAPVAVQELENACCLREPQIHF